MESLYLAYSDQRPATLCINGHRVLVVGQDGGQLEPYLELLKADRVLPIDSEFDSVEEALHSLAEASGAEVFLAPVEMELDVAIRQLEEGLPWVM